MQFNKNSQIQKENNKLFVTLNDLIDDMEYENNINSDMYQERGEIYDKEKLNWNLNRNSNGRFNDKYIHSVMSFKDLNKFKPKIHKYIAYIIQSFAAFFRFFLRDGNSSLNQKQIHQMQYIHPHLMI